jgi:ABC-type transport system involved in multi-copper enzyme maturation permease subunit
MSTTVLTPYSSTAADGRAGFAGLLRAEWTKLRTVRGWLIALLLTMALTPGIAALDHSECSIISPSGNTACSATIGPGGIAVQDDYYLLHQTLNGNGDISARITSLTGAVPGGSNQNMVQPWSKAGLIITDGTSPGAAYAAVMATGGNGVRMQYDYVHDTAGMTGAVSSTSPRWLRLSRSGDTITGYDSTDGVHWTPIESVSLAGLPDSVQVGMFATSPGTTSTSSGSLGGHSSGGSLVAATGTFDHVILQSPAASGNWTASSVGMADGPDAAGGPAGGGPGPAVGAGHEGGVFTVTGTGDIGPDNGGTPVEQTLTGLFAALAALIVVAAMFMAGEYRRGMIRATLAAHPRRGRVLAAKTVVIGTTAFACGLVGVGLALPIGESILRSNGNYFLPVSTQTEVRVIAGVALLTALIAVLALSLAAILRSSAAAITCMITCVVLPYVLAKLILPSGAAEWLLRVTPAAGFAVEQTLPRYTFVSADYSPAAGYYPLSPWQGIAVLTVYTVAALTLASVLLRRRDA